MSLVVCDLLGSTHAQKSYLCGHLDSYLKTVLQKYSHVLRLDTDSPCELSCDGFTRELMCADTLSNLWRGFLVDWELWGKILLRNHCYLVERDP